MAEPNTRAVALAKLREQFAPEHIGKLPKVNCWDCTQANNTKRGTTCPRHMKQNCKVCGNYLTTAHIHIDYVGHAEVTDRLLDADPEWTWEPLATDERGLPVLDGNGGLWMRLTVAGVTRIGYGDGDGRKGADGVKVAIGDALRNAALRFGVALNQWAKSDLHADEHDGPDETPPAPNGQRLRLADDPHHINPGQVAMIDSLFNRREISDDTERGRLVEQILGRPVGGIFMLTPDEADTVITALTPDESTAEQPAAAR